MAGRPGPGSSRRRRRRCGPPVAVDAEDGAGAGRARPKAAVRVPADLSGAVGEGWTLRLAVAWARSVPLPDRGGDWIAVVEQLLAAAVDAEHTAACFRCAPSERATLAEERAAAGMVAAFGLLLDDVYDAADWEGATMAEAARLPESDIAHLLRELLRTAHPAGPGGGSVVRWRHLVQVTGVSSGSH